MIAGKAGCPSLRLPGGWVLTRLATDDWVLATEFL